MSHEIRQEEGDPANPSSQQLKTATGRGGEGVTEKELAPDYGPGGKEAHDAKDKGKDKSGEKAEKK
jgi:hypothetical protein